MSDRESHIAFIKRLALYQDDPELFALQERIAQAEREERTVRGSAALVGIIGLIAAWGLGYCAVFLDGFFQSPPHIVVKFLSALSLGCFLCLAAYSVYWIRHRAVINRLYHEIRTLLLTLTETRFHSIRRQFAPLVVPYRDTSVSGPAPGAPHADPVVSSSQTI
jgi:hypothetical protein